MAIKKYFLSFETWLNKMEEKHKKLTAILIGIWVFGTVGFFIKSVYIYSDIWHNISGYIFN